MSRPSPARVVALILGLALLGGCTGVPERSAQPPPAAEPAAPGADAAPGATIVATRRIDRRTIDLTVRSPAVGADVPVRLLLPAGHAGPSSGDPGASRSAGRDWPVLLLLHGCCSGYRSWTAHSSVEEITRGSDVLVVMPHGGRAGFYSDWLDGPGWETFHTQELVALLRTTYAASDRWAVAGLSMGGLGALAYAARNPGQFRAVAAFSGIADTLHNATRPDNYQGVVRAAGGDPDDLWGDPVADMDVWRAHNPTDLAPRLRGTPVFVSAGNGYPGPLDADGTGIDLLELALWAENRSLRRALRAAGVEATFDFYGPGTHSWPYWDRALRRAWPLLQRSLHA